MSVWDLELRGVGTKGALFLDGTNGGDGNHLMEDKKEMPAPSFFYNHFWKKSYARINIRQKRSNCSFSNLKAIIVLWIRLN